MSRGRAFLIATLFLIALVAILAAKDNYISNNDNILTKILNDTTGADKSVSTGSPVTFGANR
jgi:hypothetical protein